MSGEEARVQALGALYAADVLHEDQPDTERLSGRATRLVTGVWENLGAIDEAIEAAATDWRLERMSAVDRNILRLGTYELGHTDTPRAVVMDEAVELAKRYSTGKSGAFVNGVLAAVEASGSGTTRM